MSKWTTSIHVPRKQHLGKTRSEQTMNIRKEWAGHGGLDNEHLDKCRFLEKRVKEKWGPKAANYLRHADIAAVKSIYDKKDGRPRRGES